MDWRSVGKQVAKAAPVLGTVLGGPAGGAVGALVASVFGGDPNDPQELEKLIKADPDAAVKLKQIEAEHKVELQRLVVQSQQNELQAQTNQLVAVNKTMQAELQSGDGYARRWRPTFGYVVCITWTLQTVGIVWGLLYAILNQPENAGNILTAMGTVLGALTIMWSIALSVLGVNISSRSNDKAIQAGQQPGGLLGAVAARIKG